MFYNAALSTMQGNVSIILL